MNETNIIKKLNFGCGNKIKEGYLNMDILELPGVELKHDFEVYPYPFENESFDEILCWSVLEHLKDPLKVLKELHRILKKGGSLKFRVPLAGSIASYTSPTYKNFFVPQSFLSLTKEHPNNYWIGFDYKVKKINVTPALFHQIKLPCSFMHINSLMNNIITGIEGELIKV